mmetsp:Transcript_412/g.566  ORF Transcript_412/g.566 Transcript_412/m.566 type:complete len:216 (+) Transcript_412:535-1182(+)
MLQSVQSTSTNGGLSKTPNNTMFNCLVTAALNFSSCILPASTSAIWRALDSMPLNVMATESKCCDGLFATKHNSTCARGRCCKSGTACSQAPNTCTTSSDIKRSLPPSTLPTFPEPSREESGLTSGGCAALVIETAVANGREELLRFDTPILRLEASSTLKYLCPTKAAGQFRGGKSFPRDRNSAACSHASKYSQRMCSNSACILSCSLSTDCTD